MARPRKRVTELKLAGTFNQHSSRKTWNTDTPCPLEERPAPKRYLKRTQLAWYQFFQVKMIQGIVSIEDETHIIMMFDSLDLYYRISDKINEYWKNTSIDEYLKDWKLRAEGKDLLAMRSKCLEDYNKIARQFGLTQAERTKIQIPENDDSESELFKILRGDKYKQKENEE